MWFNTLVALWIRGHISWLVTWGDTLILSKHCLIVELYHIYLLLMALDKAWGRNTEHGLLQGLWLLVLKYIRILHVLNFHLWCLWYHDLFLGWWIWDYKLNLSTKILQYLSIKRCVCRSIRLLKGWMKLLLILLWLWGRHLNRLESSVADILSVDSRGI